MLACSGKFLSRIVLRFSLGDGTMFGGMPVWVYFLVFCFSHAKLVGTGEGR